MIIAALAAPPVVHIELVRPNLVVDGIHRARGLIAYQVAVQRPGEWTDDMKVCYLDIVD
jgi:hypothetical protein